MQISVPVLIKNVFAQSLTHEVHTSLNNTSERMINNLKEVIFRNYFGKLVNLNFNTIFHIHLLPSLEGTVSQEILI